MSEQELDRLSGTRLQLEMQVTTLESANLNAETLGAMKKASDALKVIHGNMCVIPLGYRSHPVPAMCLFHQRSRARVALPRVKGLFAVLGSICSSNIPSHFLFRSPYHILTALS